MKFVTVLLVLLAVAVGALVLIPVVGIAAALAIPLACFFIWLLPILIIACSDRTTAGEKLAWILAIIFLSWFAWIFYFLLAPIKERREYAPYHGRRSYRYDTYRYD